LKEFTMRIAAGLGMEAIGGATPPAQLVQQARAAEMDGFPSAWCVHFSRTIDALSALAAAAVVTSTIELAVGVVPTYPRHPIALAQQAATVQALAGGRLTLGVGVSHRPVIEGMHGLPYVHPARHMREYLSVLGPLLREGRANFRGEFYAVEAELTVPDTTPVSILVGGLSANMVRLAGELADGVVTWMAGPRSLEGDVLPNLKEGADAGGRPSPRMVVALPVAVCDDIEAGREAADVAFARYRTLTNYRRLMDREGILSPAEIALIGPEAAVGDRLRAYAALGATEFWPVVFPVGTDPAASVERSRAFLCGVAPVIG
jgi:5,10-methylenetetrahydromethanopterin reductase